MNRIDYNLFTISILPMTQNVVGWGAECNTICFWNKGRQDVTINGVMTLQPGESFTFNISNSNLIYVLAEVNGEDVSATYLN